MNSNCKLYLNSLQSDRLIPQPLIGDYVNMDGIEGEGITEASV